MRNRSWSRRIATALAICALWGLGVASASADDEGEGWAYELPNDLMSPFCPGRTIAACTSSQAESLRLWLVIQEAAGRTRQDVEKELYARYGDVIRPAPKPDGFGATAYLFPVAAFLGGGVFVAFYLRRQTHSAPDAAPPPPSPKFDPELERLLDEELAG